MHASSLALFLSTLMSTALALGGLNNGYQHRREAKRALMVARQTLLPTGTCFTGLLSAYASIPTPPPAILSYLDANPITDPCDTATIPPSLSGEFASWTGQLSRWYATRSSEISSYLSESPWITASPGGENYGISPICTSAAGGGSGSGSGSGAGTVTGGDSVPGPTGAPGGSPTQTGGAGSGGSAGTENSGSREMGYAAAGLVAAAAFLGVALAL